MQKLNGTRPLSAGAVGRPAPPLADGRLGPGPCALAGGLLWVVAGVVAAVVPARDVQVVMLPGVVLGAVPLVIGGVMGVRAAQAAQ